MPNKRELFLFVIVNAADDMARRGIPLDFSADNNITMAAKSQRVYERSLERVVRDRYEGRTSNSEFTALFSALMYSNLRRAWIEGAQELGVDEMTTEDENELAYYQAEEDKHIAGLLAAILAAVAAGLGWQSLQARLALWANRYADMRNRALVVVGKRKGANLMWEFGDTVEHCRDCGAYAGQVKTAREWDDIYRMYGHAPQASDLECEGWRCDCRLRVV